MSEVTPIDQGHPAGLALAMRGEIPGADGIDPALFEAIVRRTIESIDVESPDDKKWYQRLSGKTVTAAVFSFLLVAIQGVVQGESWRGLTQFARLIHITGAATQGVPLTLDGVSTLSALLALRAELNDESSARERASMYAFTLSSCAANYWGGMHFGGQTEALYFGGMSLAVMIVFDILLRQIRVSIRRRKGRKGNHVPQFGLLNWVLYPALTFSALALAVKEGHETASGAIEAAKQARQARKDAAAEAEAAKQYADLPALAIDTATLTSMNAQARLAVAFGALGKTDVPAAVAMLKQHGAPVDSSHAYKVRRELLEGGQS